MQFDLEEAVGKIKLNKNFLKLRDIIENNSYHDHESVFEHLIKTYEKALSEIKGNFIKDEEVAKLFQNYISVKVGGIEKKDLMVIFALTHDIGKAVVFNENGEEKSIMLTDSKGITSAPYHEYFGSLILGEMTKEVGFSEEALFYLSKCLRLHGTFNGVWQDNRDKTANDLLMILKKASEGIHVEQIFNGWCDCYSAPPFQPAIPLIHELLNMPKTYKALGYSIAN